MTTERDFKGVWIPKQIWLNKDLGWTEKMILVEVDSLSKNGECFASNHHFAEFLGVSERQIQNITSSLQEKGYIKMQYFYKGNTKIVTKRIIKPTNKFMDEENFIRTDEQNFAHMDEQNFAHMDEENFVDINTSNNTNNNTIKDNVEPLKKSKKKSSLSELHSEFELLWAKYPRKRGKEKAKSSYIYARNEKKYTFEEIENGLNRYIEHLKAEKTEDCYILNGSTWFNQKRWNDSYVTISNAPKKNTQSYLDYYKSKFGVEPNVIPRNSTVIEHDTSILP